jgi:phosphomethylpyrimidine synthase
MSQARKDLDWQKQIELALDPATASKGRSQHDTKGSGCSMCGEYCAMELVADYLGTGPDHC